MSEHAQVEKSIPKPLAESTTRKISRRALISEGAKLGLGLTTLSLLPSACGGAAGGAVPIQFAAYIDTTGEQSAEINKFNQLHAGKIKVNYLQLPPVATDQYNKIITSFQFQSPTPDVVQIDVTWP